MTGETIFKISVRVPNKFRDKTAVPDEVKQAGNYAAQYTIRQVRRFAELAGANVTRDLINSVASKTIRNDAANAWSTRNIFFKEPGSKYWRFVNNVKKAGKMPVEFDGKKFVPFPHVLNWLRFRGISPSRWYPVLKAIADRFNGYHFVEKAVGIARPHTKELMRVAMKRAAKRMGLTYKS